LITALSVASANALPTQAPGGGLSISSVAQPTLFSSSHNAACETALGSGLGGIVNPSNTNCDSYTVVVRNEGSLSTGIARVGETETCEPGAWAGSPSEFEFEWVRGPAAAQGPKALGKGSTYTIKASDEGYAIVCRVTARNASGATVGSASPLRVAPLREALAGTPMGIPALLLATGKLQAPIAHPVGSAGASTVNPGEVLECTPPLLEVQGSLFEGSGLITEYRWLENGVPNGKRFKAESTFKVPAGAAGKAIQCEVAVVPRNGGTTQSQSTIFADSPNPLTVTPAPGEPAPSLGSLTLANAPSISGVRLDLKDSLPAGVTAAGLGASILTPNTNALNEIGCEFTLLTCSIPVSLPPGWGINMRIEVTTQQGAGAIAPNFVEAIGGGTAPRSSVQEPPGKVVATPIGEGPSPFAVQALGLQPFGLGGLADRQAADHPTALTTDFQFPTAPREYRPPESAYVRDLRVTLPPGLIGNPLVSGRCPYSQLSSGRNEESNCAASSQVGLFNFTIQGGNLRGNVRLPIYNMTPQGGYPAQFAGIYLNHEVTMFANVVRAPASEGGYAVQVTLPGVPAVTKITSGTVTFFGDPAVRRGDGAGEPFLTNPSACGKNPSVRFEADSWQEPHNYKSLESRLLGAGEVLEGCSLLQFSPTISMEPEVRQADSPSGYTFHLVLPQAKGGAPTLATPELKDATVTLPEGVVVSPSSADGLQACTPVQIDLPGEEVNGDGHEDGQPHPTPGHCPLASKIASATVTTPLLEAPLEGSVYLGAPECSPCRSADAQSGRMLKLYIEARGSGVIVKLPGSVSANPATGRLEATFANNPQLPFSDLRLNFKTGQRAPLANPQACGAYTTTSDLTPWSTPETPDAYPSSRFEIGSGPAGSACASSEAAEPNAPSFEAGTQSPLAAAFSPFVMHLSRADGTQRLKALNLTLPPGLTGKLADIPYCPDPAIEAARAKSGRAEQSSPSCAPASEVGTVTVAAGPGAQPYQVQGHAYLGGPYKGAPYSLAIITPAVAGPFDLGTVVVRAGLYVDPTTAQITVRSDEIPHILAGIPLDIRSIAVSIDRSEFTLNPTNCEAMSITGQAISLSGNAASLQNRFQVGGCKGLDFKPKLALRVFGKTNRNAKPRFRAVLQSSLGEANIKRAQVNLPHSEFLEQNHIKTVCTRVQYAQGDGNGSACPKGSIYGHARAWTPLLDRPLEGPVYLRSSSHKLPDLVAALNGQVQITLVGKVDSGPNKGIRNTFEMVPDAPVSKFILTMKGGKKGLLVNSEDLCSKQAKTSAIVRLTGQNGAVEHWKPKVRNSCGKKHRKSHGGHHK
jgi:hypothetical protein